jgi:hypothetical protein
MAGLKEVQGERCYYGYNFLGGLEVATFDLEVAQW